MEKLGIRAFRSLMIPLKYQLIILWGGLLLGGCQLPIADKGSSDVSVSSPLLKKTQEKDPTSTIAFLSRHQEFSVLKESPIFLNTTDQILKKFETDFAHQKFLSAAASYRSLHSLGRAPSSGATSFYRNYAQALVQQGHIGAALVLFCKQTPLEKWKTEELVSFSELLLSQKSRTLLQKVSQQLEKRGISRSEEIELFLKNSASIEAMIGGSVTIWVDHGIVWKTGKGVPEVEIGSGFFIDVNGYLITNYHVIKSEVDPAYEGYSRLFVRPSWNQNQKISAQVVGWDENLDIALLKTTLVPTFTFSLGRREPIRLGEEVSTIGSPGGLGPTLTTGRISGLQRPLLALGDAIQIDVPSNPGNSGGPLLDEKGAVIGVVFAEIAGFENTNFAIPSTLIKKILPKLYSGGEVAYGWLGVGAYDDEKKMRIFYVAPGSVAEKAGLQPGDHVTHLNDQPVSSIAQIQKLLLEHSEGELIRLNWNRKGEELTRFIRLAKRGEVPLKELLKKDSKERLLPLFLGLKLTHISTSFFGGSHFRVERVIPGMLGDDLGFLPGDTFRLYSWEREQEILNLGMVAKRKRSGFWEESLTFSFPLVTRILF